MICFIDPQQAPLRNVPSALQERKITELAQSLSERGIQLVGGDEDRVYLNLRGLALANGSIERGQQTLYAALEELACVRIDCEAQDAGYVLGQGIVAHSISRALESGTPAVVSLLTCIEPHELFTNLDRAWTYICGDGIVLRRGSDGSADPNSAWLQEQLRMGAENDLRAHGLLDGPADTSWMEPAVDPLTVGLDEYARSRSDIAPFRSSWDQDE
jgi:hypothetical protein